IDGRPQIWTLPIVEEGGVLKAGTPTQFLTTQFEDGTPMLSPDGRWVAYASTQSGRNEVYVRSFSAVGTAQEVVPVSGSGGALPVWSPSGSDLFYQSSAGIMAAHYSVSGTSFAVDTPRVWASSVAGSIGFDLSSDGKRAAVIVPVNAVSPQEHTIVLIQNFF